jgi:hypothetical protein
MSDDSMKKADSDPGLRSQYDFSGGVRGKYAARYEQGTNIVVLDPDVATIFKTSEAVNEALREVARLRGVGGA